MPRAVGRHPIGSAVVTLLALLIITSAVTNATRDVAERTWPMVVILGHLAGSAFTIWFMGRKVPVPDRRVFEALSAAPTFVAGGLAFQGAPEWSCWLALLASGALLAASMLLTRPRAAPEPG